MGPRLWTTAEQENWLGMRIQHYVQVVRDNQVSEFWISLEEEWTSVWPTGESNVLESNIDGIETLRKVWLMHLQICDRDFEGGTDGMGGEEFCDKHKLAAGWILWAR
ncbi:hypothetical protein B0H11DRAFT_1938759 [Mycena galericulata]|nr:hypothetical protein B0H11DRAFT_1938759 [Mycena galericulata]